MTINLRKLAFAAALLFLPFLCAMAEPAPIAPTNGLYVNDFANLVFSEHRAAMTQIAAGLDKSVSIQVVVITTNSLADMTLDGYAQRVYTSWRSRGELKEDAVLVLQYAATSEWDLFPFGRAAGLLNNTALREIREAVQSYRSEKNYSPALLECVKLTAKRLYAAEGIAPDAEISTLLETGTQEGNSKDYYAMVALVLGLLVVMRGLHVMRKYQKKYGAPRPYKRRHFRVQRRAFDEDDTVDIIELDDK